MMKRVLLDANLLLLLAVGETEEQLIGRHPRLRQYDVDAFRLLIEIVEDARNLVVLPNILTEVSNLLPYRMSTDHVEKMRQALAGFVNASFEDYVPSRKVVGTREYLRLGLADAALLQCRHNGATLWTDDMGLYLAAENARLVVRNFTHFRTERGNL